jgi:hypothetical protein
MKPGTGRNAGATKLRMGGIIAAWAINLQLQVAQPEIYPTLPAWKQRYFSPAPGTGSIRKQ